MTTKSTEGADVVRRLAVMDLNNTSGTGSPSRPRSRTSPNIPRANVNPVTIDSPVIKAVEILEKIKKGKQVYIIYINNIRRYFFDGKSNGQIFKFSIK
jgi:hypothetical protein